MASLACRWVPLLAPLLLLLAARAPAALGGSRSALLTRDLPANLCELALLLLPLLRQLCGQACASASLGKAAQCAMPFLPWLSSSAGWLVLARTICPAMP